MDADPKSPLQEGRSSAFHEAPCSGAWTAARPANHVLPCPHDWLVEVEHFDGTYTVAKAKEIRWGGRPHAAHLEVKEWRVLEGLPHSDAEREYAMQVQLELDDLFGFSPAGELADLIEETLAIALDRVSLLINAAISSPNAEVCQPEGEKKL